MKKWMRSLLMIVCVLCLTACGSKSATATDSLEMSDDQKQQWYSSAEQLVTTIDQSVRAGTTDLYADDAVYGPAFESYQGAVKDIGDLESVEGKDIAFTKKEGVITMLVHGTSHDADVVITVKSGDNGYEPSAIVTNVDYSFGELIQQAGLNTLLGMGTTFVVLILLAVIIALFGKILTAGFGTKKAEESKAAPKQAPAVAAPVEEELADDTELVAVIAAAIAAYEGKTSTDGFVVRSIRKARKRY